MLGFIMSTQVTSKYLTMPADSVVWDLQTQGPAAQIERVLRRAVRWVMEDYKRGVKKCVDLQCFKTAVMKIAGTEESRCLFMSPLQHLHDHVGHVGLTSYHS